jgi:hypothetical protein
LNDIKKKLLIAMNHDPFIYFMVRHFCSDKTERCSSQRETPVRAEFNHPSIDFIARERLSLTQFLFHWRMNNFSTKLHTLRRPIQRAFISFPKIIRSGEFHRDEDKLAKSRFSPRDICLIMTINQVKSICAFIKSRD